MRKVNIKILVLIGILGIALGALIAYIIIPDSETSIYAPQPVPIPESEPEPVQPADYTRAIEYLNREKYIKSEMDAIPELNGLWDMLNHYDFQGIKELAERCPELMNSSNFNEILTIINQNLIINQNPISMRSAYCCERDSTITISHYYNKLRHILTHEYNCTQNESDSHDFRCTHPQDEY